MHGTSIIPKLSPALFRHPSSFMPLSASTSCFFSWVSGLPGRPSYQSVEVELPQILLGTVLSPHRSVVLTRPQNTEQGKDLINQALILSNPQPFHLGKQFLGLFLWLKLKKQGEVGGLVGAAVGLLCGASSSLPAPSSHSILVRYSILPLREHIDLFDLEY